MTEKTKVAMMTAAAKALEYLKKNPKASHEEIFQHVMKTEKAKGEAKLGAMAAVSKAIKYKEMDSTLTDKKVMQKIMDESIEILENISAKG